MNEQEHYNDDFIREQLSGYREMPPAPVWEGIEKALDAKKKKRRVFFWLFFAGTGMVGMLLALNLFQSGTNQMARNTHTGITPFPNLKNTITFEQSNSENLNESTQNQPIKSDGSVHFTPKKENAQAQKLKDNTLKSKQTALNTNQTVRNNKGLTTATALAEKPNNESSRIEDQVVTPQYEQFTSMPNTFAMSLQQTYPMGKFSLSNNQTKDQANCQLIPFVGIEGGAGALGYHRKNNSTNPSNAGSNPDSSGSSSRKFGIHSFATVYGGFRYKKYLSFSAGIGYENLYSVNPYKANYSAIGLTNDLLTEPGSLPFGMLNVVAPPDFEFSSAPLPIENGTVKFSSHYLHAPVMLGFHLPIKNFSFGIQAGPAFHILIAQNARFINENGEERDIILKTPNRFNISLGIEPQLAYRIRNLELVAAGNFRYRFLNIWQNSEARIMPYNLSGSIGLRYHFGCR